MIKVSCPKCKHENELYISNALDEHGEVYKCESCGYLFRYTEK